MRLRAASLLAALLALTACGLHPVYGTRDDGTSVAEELNSVAIDTIPDRIGQNMRNELIDRMYGKGRPAQPSYHLSIKLNSNEEDIGLLSNATSTLAKIDSYANFSLIETTTNKVVLSGTAHSSTSYDRLDNQYATLAANRSAIDRTVNELSEQVVNRLSLFFSERAAYDQAGLTKAEADARNGAKAKAEREAEDKAASDRALKRKAEREKAAADHAAGIDSGSWLSGN